MIDAKKQMIDKQIDAIANEERHLGEALERMSNAYTQYAASSRLLLSDLARHGYRVTDIDELPDVPGGYATAIPILLDWFEKTDDVSLKLTIILLLNQRTLRKMIVPALIREFVKLPECAFHTIKWQIGDVVEHLADDSYYDMIVPTIVDTSHGTSRQMLVVALGRMKKRAPEAIKVLTELLKNDDLVGHVLIALRKLNGKEARPYVERYLTTKQTWVRKEAEKAIARFDRPDPQAAKAQ